MLWDDYAYADEDGDDARRAFRLVFISHFPHLDFRDDARHYPPLPSPQSIYRAYLKMKSCHEPSSLSEVIMQKYYRHYRRAHGT